MFIKNNRDFSVALTVTKDGKDKQFVFDCFRQYSDTGNVATTGITEISDEDFKWLSANCKQFSKLIEEGKFTKTDMPSNEESEGAKKQAEKLKAENKALKEKAKQIEDEAKKAKAELNDVKSQLESLKKGSKEADAKDAEESSPEGF